MVLTLCPSGGLTKYYLPCERKFRVLQYMVCPERALVVGTGFLNILLMFYYDDVKERRVIKYTYISLLYNNCLKSNPASNLIWWDGRSCMVRWTAQIIISYFIYY